MTTAAPATYPDELDVRPLTTWVGPLHTERRIAPYSATIATTLEELGRELRALGVSEEKWPYRRAILEVAIPPDQWRVDGKPRVRATAVHPGIVLSLTHSSVGPLRFACDRYTTWHANLRAVVLTMEALRAVERHGAVRAAQQYAGFRALESGIVTGGGLSPEDARKLLLVAAEAVEDYRLSDQDLKRRARARAHPDRHGGDRTAWDRVEAALKVLGLLDAA